MIGSLLLAGGLTAIAALGDLTVPVERLPAGCAVPRSEFVRIDGNQSRGGLWAGLSMRTNPASSSEPKLIVEIRERIEGPRLTPDAPALTARDAARFRMQLVDAIDEAYAATYQPSDSFQVIVVYGLRFHDARAAAEFWSGARAANNPVFAALTVGPIVAVTTGPRGACLDAVAAHLQSLRD
jgi:hypothetical protein